MIQTTFIRITGLRQFARSLAQHRPVGRRFGQPDCHLVTDTDRLRQSFFAGIDWIKMGLLVESSPAVDVNIPMLGHGAMLL